MHVGVAKALRQALRFFSMIQADLVDAFGNVYHRVQGPGLPVCLSNGSVQTA